MATIFSHAIAATALRTAFPPKALPRGAAIAGAICSVLPDADVIGFACGVRYGDFLGHRGFTHSLVFAAALSLLVALLFRTCARAKHRVVLWSYLFLATASHGVLDGLTNGGLGVAFFAPFDNSRYFFPFTPIAVSPIGVSFFSERGLSVLANELAWVCLPGVVFVTALSLVWRHFPLARARSRF